MLRFIRINWAVFSVVTNIVYMFSCFQVDSSCNFKVGYTNLSIIKSELFFASFELIYIYIYIILFVT